MICVLSSPTNYKYGFWGVIFPPGSACTLTNGTRTYKAPARAVEIGRYTFPIPASGTWTVSCTDGTHTASKTQTISTQYSYFATTLAYQLYIFKAGVGMTSGYSASFAPYTSSGSASNSISSNAITWATNASYGGNMVISPAIDLSSYKTLHVELDYTGQYDNGRVTFGVGNSTIGTSVDASTTDTYNTSKHTITIDVSAINSKLYIKSYSRQSAGRFYNIWLT